MTQLTAKLTTNPALDLLYADQVFIEGLRVDAVIGVYEWERNITQPLLIDAQIVADQAAAAKSDDIKEAINYKKVCEEIRDTCQRSKANLLERLAEDIAQMILMDFKANIVVITVRKPTAIAETKSVGVRIVRSKAG